MVRVVPDTNILISALMFGGLPAAFLDLGFLQSFQLVTSSVLLDELDDKLRLKFRVSPADADVIRARLEKNALLMTPDVRLAVIKDDPDDDRVLECAIAGKADYIVSGDRHLLNLGAYEGIAIQSVRQFMDAIDAEL